MDKKFRYFYGLDAFRGIAAILVIIGHVELVKSFYGINNSFEEGFFFYHHGETAVTFFFVLSGFLITYLILEEEKLTGKLSLKKFYVRRVLRIWPVYFLMVIVGFYLFPYNTNFFTYWPQNIPEELYSTSLFHYLFFLPNISPASNPVAFQSWSIGVEEQFYLFWPLIFLIFKNNSSRIVTLLFLFILIPCIKLSPRFIDLDILIQLKSYFVKARFENMALGGIYALMIFQNKGKLLENKVFGIASNTVLLAFIVFEVKLPLNFHTFIYPILFANLIVWLSNTIKSSDVLENQIFKYLGKISYGMYMYHIIPIYLCLNLIYDMQGDELYAAEHQIMLHALVLISTILISSISYHTMEKPILYFKNKFK